MQEFKSGFVAVVGRPNVGKSSLVNKIIGKRVSIVTKHSGTTQRNVRGIYDGGNSQIIFVDTPGYSKPRKTLGKRLNESVSAGISDGDIVLFCTPSDEPIGPGDRRIIDSFLQAGSRLKFAVITKTDKVSKQALLEKVIEIDQLGAFSEIIPITVKEKDASTLQTLISVIEENLEEGPQYYEKDTVSDEDYLTSLSELIRQEVLQGLEDELMHSVAVVINEDSNDEEIYASVYVERDSQKPIIIGRKGENIGRVRRAAKHSIKAAFGVDAELIIKVKVAKNWQQDPKALERLGL